MRIGNERLTAFSAFAALALGAAGMVFERAGPAVLSADRDEFASWARAHHRELVVQSVFLSLGTAPLLVFFTGLRACLDRGTPHRGPVDLSLVVLAGGAVWVTLNLVGQAVQAAMAMAAKGGAAAERVAALGDRMRVVLSYGNAALGTALSATAVLALRGGRLPRWLGWLSAAAAVPNLASLAGVWVEEGPLSGDGVLGYAPYPLVVAWLVSVAVSLLRKGPADPAVGWTTGKGTAVAAGHSRTLRA